MLAPPGAKTESAVWHARRGEAECRRHNGWAYKIFARGRRLKFVSCPPPATEAPSACYRRNARVIEMRGSSNHRNVSGISFGASAQQSPRPRSNIKLSVPNSAARRLGCPSASASSETLSAKPYLRQQSARGNPARRRRPARGVGACRG